MMPSTDCSSLLTQIHRKHPKDKFHEHEDDALRKLVGDYGENDWQTIARKMPRRNPRQCKERWFNYLSPSINARPWTDSEDDLLLAKVNAYGFVWRQIASFFDSRTDIGIRNRWQLIQRRMRRRARRESIVAQPLPASPSAGHENPNSPDSDKQASDDWIWKDEDEDEYILI
jgi:hypothetical protein